MSIKQIIRVLKPFTEEYARIKRDETTDLSKKDWERLDSMYQLFVEVEKERSKE